ncbi:vesicle-associated membrane protein 8-like [Daphnia carinata]|uniref:vesicle-associated membrane protein 8-like n=1 Tax=Daphnia carinata TaxID=120202 RepID=UPI00257FE78A|nr:vesicle-associated membrane protein 8-like [Daphnia carinata]
MSSRPTKPGRSEGADFEREQLLDAVSNDSDEDFVLRNKVGESSSDNKLRDVKSQVEEVTNVMKENVHKLFARGDQLDDLNERSENLRSASDEFHSASSRLRKTMWWKEMRTRLALGSLCILVVLVMIIWLAVKYH